VQARQPFQKTKTEIPSIECIPGNPAPADTEIHASDKKVITDCFVNTEKQFSNFNGGTPLVFEAALRLCRQNKTARCDAECNKISL